MVIQLTDILSLKCYVQYCLISKECLGGKVENHLEWAKMRGAGTDLWVCLMLSLCSARIRPSLCVSPFFPSLSFLFYPSPFFFMFLFSGCFAAMYVCTKYVLGVSEAERRHRLPRAGIVDSCEPMVGASSHLQRDQSSWTTQLSLLPSLLPLSSLQYSYSVTPWARPLAPTLPHCQSLTFS